MSSSAGGIIATAVIEYTFKFADGRVLAFQAELDAPAPRTAPAGRPAFWTELAYNQCPGCPLVAAEHPGCPAALALEAVGTAFADFASFETVEVEARTPERTIVKRTDLPTALRSFMGLKLATCGCPILSRLRGPARLHLPFANFEETLFRMAGAYLIKQYLTAGQGGSPDWKLTGLAQLYGQLEEVNIHLKRRFDALDKKDANLNAIVAFLTFSSRTLMSLDEQLAELAPFPIDSTAGKTAEPPAGAREASSAAPPSGAAGQVLIARKKLPRRV